MSVVLLILIIVMGLIVHKIYSSLFTVIHFSFQSVFTEWFWCIMIGAIIGQCNRSYIKNISGEAKR